MSCAKEELNEIPLTENIDMVVTHKEGNRSSNLFWPLGKALNTKGQLYYRIIFNDNCLYPPLPNSPITGLDENSSWNKLIYLSGVDPHYKSSSFGWRYFEGKLELSARVYDHDSGDSLDHVVLWQTEIFKKVPYYLKQFNLMGQHIWMMNDSIVASYDEEMPSSVLSQPWFGGGDGDRYHGNVPNQRMDMDIVIF